MSKFLKIEIKQKSEKSFSRNMYIDGFAKLSVIFVQKNIFTLTIFKQNSDDLNKFLVKFPSWNVYFYTLPYLFSSYDKNKFHKKLQNCKGGTILKWLVAKPRSRGQALGGGQEGRAPGSF